MESRSRGKCLLHLQLAPNPLLQAPSLLLQVPNLPQADKQALLTKQEEDLDDLREIAQSKAHPLRTIKLCLPLEMIQAIISSRRSLLGVEGTIKTKAVLLSMTRLSRVISLVDQEETRVIRSAAVEI